MEATSPARAAEILRSGQKDEGYTELLAHQMDDLVLSLIGPRLWLRWKPWIGASAGFLYHSLTTLFNFQTLGEEYSGLVQVDESGKRLPGKWRRFLAVTLLSFGPLALEKALLKVERRIERDAEIRTEAKRDLLRAVAAFRKVLPALHKLNVSLFFLRGIYYHLSKRFAGVRYVSVGSGKQTDSASAAPLRLLGYLGVAQVTISLVHSLVHFRMRLGDDEDEKMAVPSSSSSSSLQAAVCPLCLEVRRRPACTPCGHVFCWACLAKAVSAVGECPVCRNSFPVTKIVPLMNYQ